jgi:hypothetical protein
MDEKQLEKTTSQEADKASALTQQSAVDESTKKAFDFAAETTKQLLTLSTAIIALTITFSKDMVQKVPAGALTSLVWAWLAYILSIVFGIWTLMALTGTLQPKQRVSGTPSIWGRNVTIPASLQILSFLAGLILTVGFGIKSLCPIWPFC